MSESIVILGAGMVGVCCGLELLHRGHQVTLVDRNRPGRETSFGNAGVMARSSLIPLNNPGLWVNLPGLIGNNSTSFRYSPGFLARNLRWTLAFLRRANPIDFEHTAAALDALIRLSIPAHEEMIRASGLERTLRSNGWLFLYRSLKSFSRARLARETFDRFGIETEILAPDGLRTLEPDLNPLFARALMVRDTSSVNDPGAVVQAYADQFQRSGGRIIRAEAKIFAEAEPGRCRVETTEGSLEADRAVVALGPWARDFLAASGYRVPMAFERGYHTHLKAAAGARLSRPVYDVDGAYVMAPMARGIRLTTGIELTGLGEPENHSQLNAAEKAARKAFPLSGRTDGEVWCGSRPTLPDCRPIIGAAPHSKCLWLAIGHQHIGFSTGPGTAKLLGALIAGSEPPIDAAPFCAERFMS